MANHVLGIYHADTMLDDAISFLAQGLGNNETIAIVSQKWSKDIIRQKLCNALDKTSIDEFEKNGLILISSVAEWYMPNGKINPNSIIKKWTNFVVKAQKRGSVGVRAFVDASYFFEIGYEKDLLDYEKKLPQQLDMPINAICAYSARDMAKFDQRSFEHLRAHHGMTIIKGIDRPKSGSGMRLVKEPVIRMILLEALGDSIKNQILRCLMREPMTGKKLAQCTCKPNTTFYRKLNELYHDGIITIQKSTNPRKFRNVYSAISSVLENGEIHIYVK